MAGRQPIAAMAGARGRAMAVAGLAVALGCSMGCAVDPMSRPAGPTPSTRPIPDARLLPDQVADQEADELANSADGTAPSGGSVGTTRRRDTTAPAEGDRSGDGAYLADGREDTDDVGIVRLTPELCQRMGDALCNRLRAAGMEAGTVIVLPGILLPGDAPLDDVDEVVRRLAELARQPQRLAETVGPAVLEQRLTPPTPPVEKRDPEPDPAQGQALDPPPLR